MPGPAGNNLAMSRLSNDIPVVDAAASQTTAVLAGPQLDSRPAYATASTHLSAAVHQQPAQQDVSLYEKALQLARQRDYDAARVVFEELLSNNHAPNHVKAWISYAQMSKKSAGRIGKDAGAEACMAVLQRGAAVNPSSGQLVQAQGLLELEQGRPKEAVRLLKRAVELQPELQPVLKWKAIQEVLANDQQ